MARLGSKAAKTTSKAPVVRDASSQRNLRQRPTPANSTLRNILPKPDHAPRTGANSDLGNSACASDLPPGAPSSFSKIIRLKMPVKWLQPHSCETSERSADLSQYSGQGMITLKLSKCKINTPTNSLGHRDLHPIQHRSPMDTVPIRPQPEPRCTAPDCPILAVHSQDLYLYEDEPPESGIIKDIFSPSNPPPRVVAAYALAEMPVPRGEPRIDPRVVLDVQAKLWESFYRHHTTPVQPNQLLGYTLRTKCKSETCLLRETYHRDGAYFHERRRHFFYTPAFGFSNPPPEIWEALERSERVEGNEEERETDLEVVEEFVNHHGFFREALKLTPTKKRKRPSEGSMSGVSKFICR